MFSGPAAILSPDGTRVAFQARNSEVDPTARIYLRSLDQLEASFIRGTEGGRDPFFSPDGQSLGFFADKKLKKISIQGGMAITLCAAPGGSGGSWSREGTIVFSPSWRVPLSKVSSRGGKPEPLTQLDRQAGEVTQGWPQFLPDGRSVLFTSGTEANSEESNIVVYSMASGKRKTVQRGGFYARYVASGHIVYERENTMWAVPFDLKRLEVTGPAVPVLEGVVSYPNGGGAQFSFSDTGSLVYVPGANAVQKSSIYWVDRDGRESIMREEGLDSYFNPAFSPDGKRLALDIGRGNGRDIWVYEWEKDLFTRVTSKGGPNINPAWTPDGQRIVYTSTERREDTIVKNLWWKRVDSTTDAQGLTSSDMPQFEPSFRPDGKSLAFIQLNPVTGANILTLSIEGYESAGWKPGEPTPFLNSPFSEMDPAFSPDGRWLAYASNEAGHFEVYVRGFFPGSGTAKFAISNNGGRYPKWSHSDKEIFYRTEDGKTMAATFAAFGAYFKADKPRLLLLSQVTNPMLLSSYDPHPDGKRFVVLKDHGTGGPPEVTFIFNFFDELRSRSKAPSD